LGYGFFLIAHSCHKLGFLLYCLSSKTELCIIIGTFYKWLK